MSAGKAYQFKGSTVQVITSFSGDSPSSPIVSITRADPAVVTETAHGRTDGDVVKITGVVGMTEVNGEAFVINVLTNNTYELLDVDSTAYGAYVSGGLVDEAVFSSFCELTGYQSQGGTSPEIPRTSICSTAQEFVVGLPDFGTTQFDYNFAPQTSVQTAVQTAYKEGTAFGTKVTLPNSGGVMVQLGFVNQASYQSALGALWTGSFTMRNTGNRHDFAT